MTGFAIAMDKGPLYQSHYTLGTRSGNKKIVGVQCTPYQATVTSVSVCSAHPT